MPTFPSLPVSARWTNPSEDLAGLREFRADYDRLMSTEGQSHGAAIAALSGLVASVRQRPAPAEVDRRCAELREALTPTDDDGPLARAHIADMLALVDMIEMLNAENRVLVDRCEALADRVTAAEGRLELARTTPGPHITPALLRRVEVLGFVPGSGEPVGWLLGYVEGLAVLLTTAQGERDELAATLANESGVGEPPSEGWAPCKSAYDDGSRYGTPRIEWHSVEARVVRTLAGWHWASCLHSDRVHHRGEFTRSGKAATARAAMIAADAATKRPA